MTPMYMFWMYSGPLRPVNRIPSGHKQKYSFIQYIYMLVRHSSNPISLSHFRGLTSVMASMGLATQDYLHAMSYTPAVQAVGTVHKVECPNSDQSLILSDN